MLATKILWDTTVKQKIEPFSLGIGIIKDITVQKSAKELEMSKKEIYQEIRNDFSIENIKENSVIKAYRKFSWKYLNIDPTKTRPSGEALVRRVLKDQSIPIINNIVYSINLASIQTRLSFSGFNLQKVKDPLIIRFARQDEEFQGLGTRYRRLTGNELLLGDTEKILCIYAYGDSDVTKITVETKEILLVAYGVPEISDEILETGIRVAGKFIQKTGGGKMERIFVTKSVH